MGRSVMFEVAGEPAPQGSKTPWGSEANPRTRPWRAAVTAEAAIAMGDRPLLEGAVSISCSFLYTRPKKHYRANGNLRDDAPRYKSSAPDLDKLCRAIGDSLKGVVLKDDAQIALWDVRKMYAPRAGIAINIVSAE